MLLVNRATGEGIVSFQALIILLVLIISKGCRLYLSNCVKFTLPIRSSLCTLFPTAILDRSYIISRLLGR